jgi:glycosyltransferase involved in cell wall biosynthesis
VITSDIRGIREQAGDAALLVDPRSVEAIAEAIYRLWDDASLRFVLAERGRHRLKLYTPEDYRRRLSAIMREGVERNSG